MVCFQPIGTRDQGSFPCAPSNMDLQRASKRFEQGRLDQEPLQGTIISHMDENRCALTAESRKNLSSSDDNNKIDPFAAKANNLWSEQEIQEWEARRRRRHPAPHGQKPRSGHGGCLLSAKKNKKPYSIIMEDKGEAALSVLARILLKHKPKAVMCCQGYQRTGLAD